MLGRSRTGVAAWAQVTCISFPWDNRPLLLTCPHCFSTLMLLSLLTNYTNCSANVCSPQIAANLVALSLSLEISMDYGISDWGNPRGHVDRHNLQERKDSFPFLPNTSLPCPSLPKLPCLYQQKQSAQIQVTPTLLWTGPITLYVFCLVLDTSRYGKY